MSAQCRYRAAKPVDPAMSFISGSSRTTSCPRSPSRLAVSSTTSRTSWDNGIPGPHGRNDTAIRNRPASAVVAAVKLLRGGRAAPFASLIWSAINAQSATCRVIGPAATSPVHTCSSGSNDTRPRCGFNPNSPVLAAGIRIDPAPSVPIAPPTNPAATAAADPPLDPPGECSRDHGFRVTPAHELSV